MSRPRKLRAAVPACLRETAAELRKPDPEWEAIRDAIRAARRLNFNRLEARLGALFTERRREQWQQTIR